MLISKCKRFLYYHCIRNKSFIIKLHSNLYKVWPKIWVDKRHVTLPTPSSNHGEIHPPPPLGIYATSVWMYVCVLGVGVVYMEVFL